MTDSIIMVLLIFCVYITIMTRAYVYQLAEKRGKTIREIFRKGERF